MYIHSKITLHSSGQSLVEVVVALGVVVLLATGLISGTIFSLKASQNSRTRSMATKYVREALEIARHDREYSWIEFEKLGGTSATPKYYCLSTQGSFLPIPPAGITGIPSGSVANPSGCADNLSVGTPAVTYTRYASFIWQPDGVAPVDKMRVAVIVSWREGNATRMSQATTDFTQWR